MVGGRQRGKVKADCWEYDFVDKQWKTFTTLPEPRGGQSACLLDGKIHVAGGEDLFESKTYNRHDIFDLATKSWSKGENLAIARHGFVSELIGGNWYIFGGGKKAGVKTLISTITSLETLVLSD